MKCKRDLGQEAEVQRWIEAILGEKVFNGNPYEDVLKDGVVLCKVMNTVSPGLTNITSFCSPLYFWLNTYVVHYMK